MTGKPEPIYVNMKSGSHRKVLAYCVKGETGFLAFWKEGVWIHIASGDDGSWHELFVFRINWLDNVFFVFKAFYNSVTPEEKEK